MRKEEARRAGEYDRWAKKHPNDARIMGGSLQQQTATADVRKV
jgi:hypothetical protein